MVEGYPNVASKVNANLVKSERKRERKFRLLTTHIRKSCRLRWRELLLHSTRGKSGSRNVIRQIYETLSDNV